MIRLKTALVIVILSFVILSLSILGLVSYSVRYNDKLSQAVTEKYQQQFKEIGVHSINWTRYPDFFEIERLGEEGKAELIFFTSNGEGRVRTDEQGELKHWEVEIAPDGTARVYFIPQEQQDFASCWTVISRSIDELLLKAKESEIRLENAAKSWQ